MKNVEKQLFTQNRNKVNKQKIIDYSNNVYLNNNHIQTLIQYSSKNNNIYRKQKPDNYILNNRKSINNTNENAKNINNNTNNNIDPRIQLIIKYLDIGKITPLLNNINFNDLLLLSRNDLVNLGLPILERNRILNFSQQFLKYTNNYSIEEINSFFQNNQNLYNKPPLNIKENKNEKAQLYYSNGFESNNIYNNLNKERDSEQELDYCNIVQGGRMSRTRTNASSSKNNISSNKTDFFTKYRELTQEVDNYMNKFKEYKQNWFDSKKKYDNLMNSYMIRGKSTSNKKNQNNIGKNVSHNKMRDNKSNMDKESLEKLKILKVRKDELKKQLEKIRDKSNHKKMIIKYLDEN